MKRLFTADIPDNDDEDDALLVLALDRFEQMGGNPFGQLFEFRLQPIGTRRRWRRVVDRLQFHADLRQLRDPVEGDNVGIALTEALQNAIARELEDHPRPPHDFVNFSVTAHGFTHAYQSINFSVGEFLARSARLDELLATLAGKLNSNESFNPQRGFHVDIVFVNMPNPSSGKKNMKWGADVWIMTISGKSVLSPLLTKTVCVVPVPS